MGQVTHVAAEPMTTHEAMRWVCRLALLAAAPADLPIVHAPGTRIAGFIVGTDEHTRPGDGVRMMQALQMLATLDLGIIRAHLDERMNAPFYLASVRAETT